MKLNVYIITLISITSIIYPILSIIFCSSQTNFSIYYIWYNGDCLNLSLEYSVILFISLIMFNRIITINITWIHYTLWISSLFLYNYTITIFILTIIYLTISLSAIIFIISCIIIPIYVFWNFAIVLKLYSQILGMDIAKECNLTLHLIKICID